ncbi:hypothetical protein EVG20_g6916 [Dentipellis fragilis]|uniref:MARVEL domain-containing protein n=1 Tax=Dentipellis fragilis TaxID=205917 RepID=A0A4Y9YIJ1_9AGAM|nr:hypothetical protein EVG20_g6916 [Dentipellis fragilis]
MPRLLSSPRTHYAAPRRPLAPGPALAPPRAHPLVPVRARLVLVRTLLRTAPLSPHLVHTFTSELVGLFVLFVFWLVGAAISTSIWGNLTWCRQFMQCRLLTALVAFAWMGWIILFGLFLTSLLHSIANSAFSDPMHGQLYARESVVYPAGTQTSEYRTSRA